MVTKQHKTEEEKAAIRKSILEEVELTMEIFQIYVDRGIIKDFEIEVEIINK